MGSYSFVVDLCNPGSKKKFQTRDNTQWVVEEFWTFLDNERSSEYLDNLGHVIVIKQKSNSDRAYCKTFEAYPLEQTEFTTIQKSLSDPFYWCSVTFREYAEAFQPRGSGSFEKILCTLTFTQIPCSTDPDQSNTPVKRPSVTKRYRYEALKNMSSNEVKSITMKTVLGTLVKAMEDENEQVKTEAMNFIAKNFKELKTTRLWQNFTVQHRDLTTEILDMLIDYMSSKNERASKVLSATVSKWDIRQ